MGDTDESDSDPGPALEYAGVLKVSPAKKKGLEAKKRAVSVQKQKAAEAAKRKAINSEDD